MSHVTILVLTLLLILSGSCGIEPVIQKGPWSLKVATSGGFAGVGTGSLTVDSTGKYNFQEPTSSQGVRKGCESTFSPKQMQPLSEAVSQADPKGWKRPDLNVAAPDAFGYKLELRMGTEEPTTVQWYDNTQDQLPPDLKRLSDVLMQTMRIACNRGAP